ncbi:MAG TPA: metallophosphoesterase [Pyrinomonadaceae bacterium]|jgi:DNA repair exonuclease SbcCD nuclease subunit
MKPKIILIDDDEGVTQKLKGLLKDWHLDYELISNTQLKPVDSTEPSKREFYEYVIGLVQENYDRNLKAILLDVFFNIEDAEIGENIGYEIGQELRIHFPELPIILFTVYENPQNALNSFNFDGFILKGNLVNWDNREKFDAVLSQAQDRRQLVIDECRSLNKSENIAEKKNPVVIHISDIHRGFDVTNDNPSLYVSTLQSLIRGNTTQRDKRIPTPNIIVVSGDITTRGSIKGYQIAKKFLLELGAALDIPKERIIICPGNHDIDREISRLSYNLDPFNSASDNLPDSSVQPNEKYIFRFAPFKNFFDDFYDGSFVYNLTEHKMFTIFDLSQSYNLVIVSFNSCEILDHFKLNQERAYISLDTVESVARELDNRGLSEFTKIAVWHHPFLGSINDQRQHQAILEKLSRLGFLLYMHGHSHNPIVLPPPDLSRGLMQFGAGTIGKMDTPADVPKHYQIFVFDFDKGIFTVFSRQRHNEDWIQFASFSDKNGNPKETFTKRLPNSRKNSSVLNHGERLKRRYPK